VHRIRCCQHCMMIRTSGAFLCFLLNKPSFVLTYQQSRFFTEATSRDHAKSIGRFLLRTRGLKPHIDLRQGPSTKFQFFKFMTSIACCLLTAPPYSHTTQHHTTTHTHHYRSLVKSRSTSFGRLRSTPRPPTPSLKHF